MTRLRRGNREGANAPANVLRAVTVNDAEIAKLKALVACGQVSGAILAPVLASVEKERSRLLIQCEQHHDPDVATVERLVPYEVEHKREIVGQLRDADRLLPAADFIEAARADIRSDQRGQFRWETSRVWPHSGAGDNARPGCPF